MTYDAIAHLRDLSATAAKAADTLGASIEKARALVQATVDRFLENARRHLAGTGVVSPV